MPTTPAPKAGESLTRKGPSVADVLRKMSDSVKADKTQVSLSAEAPSAEVVISNAMPGAVTLKLSLRRKPRAACCFTTLRRANCRKR